MELLAQNILVGLIVSGCALFSAWRLMSPTLRLKTLSFLGPAMRKLGADSAVERLRIKTIGQLAGSCSACTHNKNAVHRLRSGRG